MILIDEQPIDEPPSFAERAISTPWPVESATDISLTLEDRVRVASTASTLVHTPLTRHTNAYKATYAQGNVVPGWSPGPTLWVEDHRGVELVADAVASGFEYRSMALARDGDFLLISREHDRRFERYIQQTLKSGTPNVLRVSSAKQHLRAVCAICLDDPAALAVLVAAAAAAGRFNIMPYRSDGYAWQLAGHIAAAAQVTVHIAAPAPPLARAANNKLWFVDIARQLFGSDALPPTWSAHGPAVAAALLARLAVENERLVLKTPSSAGALGNVVYEAADLRGLSLRDIRYRIVETLATLGWSGRWPVLIGVWEPDVLASPSVQTWIPESASGIPVIEGIYEQSLVGEHGMFVGATEAELDPRIQLTLAHDAMQLALLLQQLGYVGRASFDGLLIGTQAHTPKLHWIECNARWGGVSIPMSVMRRLGIVPNSRRILIAQVRHNLMLNCFEQVLDRTSSLLYEHDTRQGVLWLSPPHAGRDSLDFIAIAGSTDECEQLANRVHERLTSRR